MHEVSEAVVWKPGDLVAIPWGASNKPQHDIGSDITLAPTFKFWQCLPSPHHIVPVDVYVSA